MRMLLSLCLVLLFAGIAGAVPTSDNVVLTIVPLFNVSVNISSTTGTFGATVDMHESRTICVGDIMNDGTVATYWGKSAGNAICTTPAFTWTLKDDGYPGLDEFSLLAVTADVATSPAYTGTLTGGVDCLLEGDHHVTGGDIGIQAGTFTSLTDAGTSPKHVVGTTRKLWVSLMMPDSITEGGTYSVTLSVQAKTTVF